ncbi:Carbon-nitrogen hydrolase [Rhizobium sp. NFR07]|uniref:conjugal transfer protein TraB n=1 Tax=Rhizobium sp. NFR07 TaxID=1566262 RepID=UPI0008DFAC63|nr:conjugal transfer protein TraB [Rhizobium sp. NFR07]SFB62589.1 Carbon-nitrogen hydrolase [Rhizobium sp. NFR07]
MRRENLFDVSLVCAAVVVGRVCWCGEPLALPLSASFPMIWSLARNRRLAAAVAAGYFLAASRGLPQGVATFYRANLWPGLLLWLMASTGFVVVHAWAWTTRAGWRRAARYLGALVLMAIPPFGILGWAHPLVASGIVFPGWGWMGLMTMATGLAIMTTNLRPLAAVAMTGFWLWSVAHWRTPDFPTGWRGVDLTVGSSLGRRSDLGRQRDLVTTALAAGQTADDVVVLPESAIGFWTPMVERLWTSALRDSGLMILAGATVVNERGYDNVLVAISQAGGRIVYRERMPVPGSMWQPWLELGDGSGGARAQIFANPSFEIAGTRVAPLICYEQLIVWPVLQSMLQDPAAIVAVGNGWWTEGTSIVSIQRSSAIAWSLLFEKPLVLSFNM